MCGRYVLNKPKDLQKRFQTENDIAVHVRYNIAPSQELPVITNKEHKTIELMRWGLVPVWADSLNVGYKMINAKAETADIKSSYKKPFRSQRCLVPATGFFEWKKEGKEKTPFFFHLKDDSIFAFAGLYNTWHDKEGKEYNTYTIITTTPNKIVKQVHDRMPVILKKEQENTWLDPDIIEPEHLKPLLTAYPTEEMDSYIVSQSVNSPKNDNVDIIKPMEKYEDVPVTNSA